MVEHDDRAAVASFFVDAAPVAGASARLSTAAAHHARVKRLAAGDVVRVVDGAGRIGIGIIGGSGKELTTVDVERVAEVPAPPAIHLRAPVADRERMLWLAEKAAELGITTWQSVRFRRSASVSPRGEGPAFADKLRARMIAALEQSGGAWLPRILPDATLETIDAGTGSTADVVVRIVLDAEGSWLAPMLRESTAADVAFALGPEGGLEPSEREVLRGSGWLPARVAATTLRFETAGLAAVSVCRNSHVFAER